MTDKGGDRSFPVIFFSQYGSSSPDDDLLLFAAPAKTISHWAGIPRKGWRVRMLFQRPIAPSRERELKEFWERASSPDVSKGESFILGPTAIVVAIQGSPEIVDGKIVLRYERPISFFDDPAENLRKLSDLIIPRIRNRLSPEQLDVLEEIEGNAFENKVDTEHDYVFEFAVQLQQMRQDPYRFIGENNIQDEDLKELIVAMEAICRPAIVVDGQHRLWGAAHSKKEINLPVVAIPDCSWDEQVYQFVVINEKAQRVDTSLLTDIFGSSLTQAEQENIREKLNRAGANVESRIASVIANRDERSPFKNMIKVKMTGSPPEGVSPYLTDQTIRLLIDGSVRMSRGWRSDNDFYNYYVSPTFPNRDDWEEWSGGVWKSYWFTFWQAVKDFYNEQGERLPSPRVMWSHVEQTNLTKGVTLRLLQSLFMAKCVERMQEIDKTREILTETLGEEEAQRQISKLMRERAIPESLDGFRDFVIDFFLEKGIPVKVFAADWKPSLDDAQGQQELWETLETAFERSKKGERFLVKGRIFVAKEEQ